MRAYSVAPDSRESGPAMAIEKLRVTNFKSFNDLEIELGQFNVLVGANASGKSNFVQIFRFLRDIKRDGIRNALGLQEGVEYVQNIKIGEARNLAFELNSRPEGAFRFPIGGEGKKRVIRAWVHTATYQFAIHFGKKTEEEFEIALDKITLRCSFSEITESNEEGRELGAGEFMRAVINGEIKDTVIIGGKALITDGIIDPFPYALQRLIPGVLQLEETALYPPVASLLFPERKQVDSIEVSLGRLRELPIAIYDFDPKLAKLGVRAARKELEGNGSNLALVLKGILDDKDGRRELTNLMRDLLPFAADLKVERSFDQSLSFKLRETYSQNYLPASLLSDGTINITALIVALFFEEKPFIIIEEPERNIHPSLISRVVNLLKEASERKQILITTHSPEIVKYVDVEDLLLISRDKEGFSTVSRPKDAAMVKTFLEHDLGVEELYVQNLLGV